MHRHTIYGHAEWARHKSHWRHQRHLASFFSLPILRGLAPPIISFILIALMVTLFNEGVLHNFFPYKVPFLHVDSLAFTLTSPILALVLVFRTNASYNRFEEARIVWGSNVNRTRDLARQALSWMQNPSDANTLDCLLRYIKAYSYCLKDHLTIDNSLQNDLLQILEPKELQFVMASKHRPNFVLQVMSELISQSQVTDFEKFAMDNNITQFQDNVGSCERIFNTPIPVAYTRLTSRMLALWHLALPLALWNKCAWLTIPVTGTSVAAFYYIEEVGVQNEEPFYILPLNSISNGIVSAVDGLCDAHKECSNIKEHIVPTARV